MATLTSCGSSEPNDLQLVMTSHLDVSMLPIVHEAAGVAVVAVLRAALMLPKSCGRVRLDSADPLHAPKIELNYLAEPEDRRRLREVTRKAWQVATSSDLRAVHDGVVLPDSETVADDDRLDAYMHEHINTYCHALGTVAMGRMDDALAAADAEGRVRGVSGLRVVDASLMPCAPRVVPNMTVIAMAERISRDWDHTRRSGTSESAPRNHAEPD